MSARYCCGLPRRLVAVRDYNGNPQRSGPPLNAIDYLEVATTDQLTLNVFCAMPTTGLTDANCRLDGGTRISGIDLSVVKTSSDVDPVTGDYLLQLKASAAGDFSTYTLRLVDAADRTSAAPGFDPRLAEIDFSFKAQCPSDFDCASVPDCTGAAAAEPPIDYLAKDYASFRDLMLDRLGVLIPGFGERNPADLQVALVELLAYVGDHLSYYQDAAATEAYLGTARSRISLRRHARLLDYAMHDGCNARAWISVEVDKDPPVPPMPGKPAIPAGSRLLTRGAVTGTTVSSAALPAQLGGDTLVFETLDDMDPLPIRSCISLHTWSDADCWLPAGSTEATLVDPGFDDVTKPAVGDVLLFEEVLSPDTGLAQDADQARRWAIRLTAVGKSVPDYVSGKNVFDVTWASEDALPFALCLSAQIAGALDVTPDVSVARGNVVLADHGCTYVGVPLIPEAVPEYGEYSPLLPMVGLAFAEAYDVRSASQTSASRMLTQDPRRALPAGCLLSGEETWHPQRDLLGSDRFTPEFVVETENDGNARLRFGDGRNGLRPAAGERLLATCRIGGGLRGNVGAEAITRLVSDDPALAARIVRVRNPMPAAGGMDPESPEQVRQYAPQAFRVQARAVTEDDYARVAEQFPGVQRAVARLRWTGSWYTVYISVDRSGGRSAVLDAAFNAGLAAYIERFRLAGYDIEIRDPVYVPLDIEVQVCVRPDRFAADVETALLRRFGTGTERGRPAFFNPDNFSFGDPLYLSNLIEAALEVPGVASVKIKTFQRWGKTAAGEIWAEAIRAAPLEVLRLDNDPNFPEDGRIAFNMMGGL
jgi:hypothetical protein